MIERDVVQLQYLSGVVLAVGFPPHMTLCHHGIRLDLWQRVVCNVREVLAT